MFIEKINSFICKINLNIAQIHFIKYFFIFGLTHMNIPNFFKQYIKMFKIIFLMINYLLFLLFQCISYLKYSYFY